MRGASLDNRKKMEYRTLDIGVIGGGLLGSAFAYGFSQRGLNVGLIDEGDNAVRTARGNFGLVWVQGKGKGMREYAKWSLCLLYTSPSPRD